MTLLGIPIEFIDAFGLGVYLLLGMLHFDLWWHRRERRSHLWLACAGVGALLVDATGMMLRPLAASPPALLVYINLTGVAIATFALVNLVASLGSGSVPRPVRALQYLLLALPVFAVPAGLQPLTVILFVGSGVLLIYASVVALRAGRYGDLESQTIARGLLALIACLVTDLAMELQLVPKVSGVPVLGFTILFLASTRALNARFQREYRELVALRSELEARVEDRTRELERLALKFELSSRTDELTGLPNRRGFLDAAQIELARARRSGRPLSIVMADIDHFKHVNDRFGHAGGDIVLRSVASVLRASIRTEDLAARWGGEEFILLFPETDQAGASQASEKIRLAIAACNIPVEGAPTFVTASFGIAAHEPGRSLDSTIGNADRALYRAKEEGRDKVVVLEPSD
ncbi:MAG: GGDEF domain-containing protein [Thermoanaerobaculia bacterium]|nr:GGDEF domain-containing protein [Thermoanaerobaculia bacterium]